MKVIGKYRLKKNLPDLKAGVIFEHREYDPKYPDRGNPAEGVMILGWLDGMCQDSWSGETYIMPGQLAKNREWFEPIQLGFKDSLSSIFKLLANFVERMVANMESNIKS